MRSRLVEKLSMAMYDCLFQDEDGEGRGEYGGLYMDQSDHIAVTAVHTHS